MPSPILTKNPVTSFFLITFAISWGAVLLIFGTGGIPATVEIQEKIGMVILLGPVLAGILLTSITDGGKGLRELGMGLLRWRVKFRWYAMALLTAPLSTLLVIGLFSNFSSEVRPALLNTGDTAGILTLAVIAGVTVGLFEELGWTGFAVPHLLFKYNIFITGIIVGITWGAWHFILFWENDSFSHTIPFLLLLARLFAWLPAYRILMVWVYERTHSLLLNILMHASLVASLVLFDPPVGGKDLLIYIILRASVLWVMVGILAITRHNIIKSRAKVSGMDIDHPGKPT